MTRPGDRGSATAEFAIALPAVALVLAAVLGGLQVGAASIRAQDAAADAARGLARGDAVGVVAGRLGTQLPGAGWEHWRSGDLACARVEAPLSGPAAALGIRAVARSCALAG